ncbi:MAG TPA: CPBP family glutamic-type intramembrane protease [Symbiobacteriaceae bacterium]|jgi:hypothetical protein
MRRWIWPVLGLVGVAIFLLLSPVANPEAQVDLNITRQQSLALSRTFLVQQGFDLTGYDSAVSFASDDDALVYLQRNRSLEESNRLAREYKVWHWSVRWFKPGEQIEYQVAVDTAAPNVLGFSRTLPEKAPGAHLTEAAALQKAGRFLEQNGYRLSEWKLVGSRSKEQPDRTDHHFEWQKTGVSVDAAYPKAEVDLQGDQPSLLRAYLLTPEPFQREYRRQSSVGDALAWVSFGLMFALWALALVFSIRLARRAAWSMGLWAGIGLTALSVAGAVNSFSLLKSQLPTNLPVAVSYATMVLVAVLGALLEGAGILFPAAAGQGLLVEMGRDGAPYFSRARERLLTPAFAASAFRGLCLAGIMLGYDTLFYYIGRKYLGVWSPATPRYSDILATPAPWLYPLTIGVTAAFSEEYTFRLFGVALAKKWLRWTPAALLVPAVMWAFAHSNYPVFPVWTRGIELTIFGTILGWVFWKYDIETTVVAHFTYDAFLVGWPLLLSGNGYYVFSGAVVTLLALVPALLGWVAARRRPKAPRVTAPAPPPAPAPEAAAAARLDIGGAWLDRLLGAIRTRPRLFVGAGLVGLAVAAVLSPRVTPTLAPEYQVTEAQAEAIARADLAQRGFKLDGLRVARKMEPQPFMPYVKSVAPAFVDAISQDYAGVRWAIRFYRPLDPVEYRVEVDMRTGDIAAFDRTLPRDAAGVRLPPDRARQLAEAFLKSRGADPDRMTLAVSAATSRDQRTDHQFVWETIDPRLPGTRIRREVVIQGDTVGEFESSYVHIPEAWNRQQSARSGWFILGGALAALGGLAGVVLAIIYLVRRQASWPTAGLLALSAAGLSVPPILAQWPAAPMAYSTDVVWSAFLAQQAIGYVFGPLAVGAGVAGLYIIGSVVARTQPEPLDLGQAALTGFATAGIAAGVSTLVLWSGSRFTAPDTAVPDVTGGYLALASFLLLPVAALALELLSRLWLQSLFSRWLKSRLMGVIAQAVVAGLIAIIGLPPGFPLQAVAAFLGNGIVYGLAYLAGGLPAVVVAGVVRALLQKGFLLQGAGIQPAAVTGRAALLLALLVPLAIWLWSNRLRSKGRRAGANRHQPEA